MSKRQNRIEPICMTCHQPVRMEFDEDSRRWLAYDRGTSKRHECKGEK